MAGRGRRPAAPVPRARRALRVAAAVAMVAAAGCRASTAPAVAPTPAPHAVRYRLTWASDDVTPTSDGKGWEVTTDLGYRVHVTRGWVTSYSTELVECSKAADARGWWPFEAASAWAGHNAGTPNPAAVKPMRVESLLDPTPHDAGTVTLAPQPYCQLHYLVARAGHDSPGLPTELDMVDVSLHVEGTYRARDATTDTAFTIHTASAYGQLFARVGDPPTDLHVDPGRGALTVEIRRRRSRLFDGVDFARMPVKAAGLRMLQGFVDGVAVDVATVDADR